MRFFHSKMGRFVYKHKRSGIIVDNILKPMRRVASSVAKPVVKPFAKKTLQSGIFHMPVRIWVKKLLKKVAILL